MAALIVTDSGNNRVRRIVVDVKTNGWSRTKGFISAKLVPALDIYGEVGERYRIESRDRLGLGDWAAVGVVVLEKSPQTWVDERKDAASQRIYRAVKE
jgi:hypothetical protein